MFEDPEEAPAERAKDAVARAKERADEFRMHAELAAVFEGVRKFDAGGYPGLDGDIARDLHITVPAFEHSQQVSLEAKLLAPKDALAKFDGLHTDEFLK